MKATRMVCTRVSSVFSLVLALISISSQAQTYNGTFSVQGCEVYDEHLNDLIHDPAIFWGDAWADGNSGNCAQYFHAVNQSGGFVSDARFLYHLKFTPSGPVSGTEFNAQCYVDTVYTGLLGTPQDPVLMSAYAEGTEITAQTTLSGSSLLQIFGPIGATNSDGNGQYAVYQGEHTDTQGMVLTFYKVGANFYCDVVLSTNWGFLWMMTNSPSVLCRVSGAIHAEKRFTSIGGQSM